MSEASTVKRLAGRQDFATDSYSWLDRNQVERTTTPLVSDGVPAGKTLAETYGDSTVEDSITRTSSRIDDCRTKVANGLSADSAVSVSGTQSAIDAMRTRYGNGNLNGHVLTVTLKFAEEWYASGLVFEDFHCGTLQVNFTSGFDIANSAPALTFRNCSCRVIVSFSSYVCLAGSAQCCFLVENCSMVRFVGTQFYKTISEEDSQTRYAVIATGGSVSFKDCTFSYSEIDDSDIVPLGIVNGDSHDARKEMLESTQTDIDTQSSRVSAVAATFASIKGGIVAKGTDSTTGVSWILFDDSGDDYNGTLIQYKHAHSTFTAQGTWDTEANPAVVFDCKLPYSYSSADYVVSLGASSPVPMISTSGTPFMELDETDLEYKFASAYKSSWEDSSKNNIDSILCYASIVGDFTETNAAGRTFTQQKFANRFYAYERHCGMAQIGLQWAHMLWVLSTGVGTHLNVFQYTASTPYKLDFLCIGEASTSAATAIHQLGD